MQDSPVFEKTDLGTGEIQTTHGALSAQARRLLILIDGQRDLQDLASLIGTDAVQQWLPALANQGYIRPLDRTAEAVPAALANTLQRHTRQSTAPLDKNTIQRDSIQRNSRQSTASIDKHTIQKHTVQKNTVQRTTTTSVPHRTANASTAPNAPAPAKPSLPVGLIAGGLVALAAAGAGAWWMTRPVNPPSAPAAESADATAAPASAAQPVAPPVAPAASGPDVVPIPAPALSPLERLSKETAREPVAPRVDAAAARNLSEKAAEDLAARPRRDAAGTFVNVPTAAPVPAPAAASSPAQVKAPAPLARAPESPPAPSSVATVVAPSPAPSSTTASTTAPAPTLAMAAPAVPKPVVLTPIKHEVPALSRRARRAGIDSGRAQVRLYINAGGTVDKVELLKAEPSQIYDTDVQRTLQAWTFEPPGRATQKDIELMFKP